jgi:hypothetical protein
MVKFSSLDRILFTFNVKKKIDEKTDLLRQEAEIVYIFPITRKCCTADCQIFLFGFFPKQAVQILYAYGNLYDQNFKKIPIL